MASLDTSEPVKSHMLNRADVFNQLIAAYQQGDILNQFTLRIRFAGEAAIDLGGVTREAFSCFWEIVYSKYFDGPRALVPSIHPGIDFSVIPTLGSILSHGYLVCGFLPVQISFPVLARILLTSDVEDQYILEAFQEYVGQQDSTILKKALQFRNFSPDFGEQLMMTLSRYGCRQLPTTLNIKKLISGGCTFPYPSATFFCHLQHEGRNSFKSFSLLEELYCSKIACVIFGSLRKCETSSQSNCRACFFK